MNPACEGKNVQQNSHPKILSPKWIICLSHQPNLDVQQSKPKNVSFIVSMMLTHLQVIPLLDYSIFKA